MRSINENAALGEVDADDRLFTRGFARIVVAAAQTDSGFRCVAGIEREACRRAAHGIDHPHVDVRVRALVVAPADRDPALAAECARIDALQLNLPADDSVLSAAQNSPLAQPLTIDNFKVGNHWFDGSAMEILDDGRTEITTAVDPGATIEVEDTLAAARS